MSRRGKFVPHCFEADAATAKAMPKPCGQDATGKTELRKGDRKMRDKNLEQRIEELEREVGWLRDTIFGISRCIEVLGEELDAQEGYVAAALDRKEIEIR